MQTNTEIDFTKRTKGEWSINQWTQADSEIRIGATGTPLIATANSRDTSTNEQKANAAFICKAANNYDALLSALKDAEDELEKWQQSFTEDEDLPKVLDTIKTAIRNAENN